MLGDESCFNTKDTLDVRSWKHLALRPLGSSLPAAVCTVDMPHVCCEIATRGPAGPMPIRIAKLGQSTLYTDHAYDETAAVCGYMHAHARRYDWAAAEFS